MVTALLLAGIAAAQPPAINTGGIVNAANYANGGVAPGSIVSIFGTNLANQTASAGSVPLPTSLANVSSVTFNGVDAPLYFVSSGLLNVQVPWNVLPAGTASGTVSVVVSTSAGSASQSVAIVAAMPGVFTVGSSGLGQGIATDNADGAIAAPAGSIANVTTHPIPIGGYLILWCTGLGAVDTPLPNGGNTGGAIVNTLLKPTVSIGGVTATPVYAVLSPQFPGEYQVAVQVAPGTPTGLSVPVRIEIGAVTAGGGVTVAVAGPPQFPAQPLTATCTAVSAGCIAINLAATDPYSTAGAFGGYADATIRQDPLTGTLWMAYSWPHTIPSGTAGVAGTQVLDTHVAFSTDGGKTWTYKGALYISQAVTNPVSGKTDYTAHEVMNLYPQVVGNVTYWYGIHATYYVPQASGGGSGLEDYSKRWQIAVAPGTAANGPMGLATAPSQFLGQPINTYPQYFPIAVDLSTLHAEVAGCTQFYEPALIMSSNTLYLFLACTPSPVSARFYAVFRATPGLAAAPNWTWTYIPEGPTKFANESDAVSAGRDLGSGATYITQMDIAPSSNPGTLLAILTAAFDNANGKNSLGCVAAELASIEPPKFVYNAAGQVQVDAVLASPDSQATGPGSCTYSAASATGMILAHRQDSKAPQNNGFFTYLMQSLLFP